jgi:lipoprotein-releasing system permease protein
VNLSLFIFSKFLKSNRDSKFLNLISSISIIGICLGVATLIIALSVVSGFEKTLTTKIIEMDSHIKIFSVDNRIQIKFEELEKIIDKYENEIDYVSPSLSRVVIVSKKGRSDGLTLKGISNQNYIEKLKSNLLEGAFNKELKNQLLIGKTFAKRLFLKIGDKVSLISLSNDSELNSDEMPNIEVFTISGIYESGITNYDDIIAFTDLSNAQEFLLSGKNLINEIDIKLKRIDRINKIVSEIRDNLKYPFYAQNIFELHRNIFNWIELQKKPIPIVLSLIIIVAVFNIISTLFLIVIERTSSIGILKALGLRKLQIVNIFLLQGIQIAFLGVLSGNILALFLMFIQNQFNLIKVPSNIYLVTKVPFDFSILIFISVSIITLILALLASVIPSLITSRINPIKAIRFQ